MMLLVFNARSFSHYSVGFYELCRQDLPMARGIGAPQFRQRHAFYGMVIRDF
jgi:hypothetical protein